MSSEQRDSAPTKPAERDHLERRRGRGVDSRRACACAGFGLLLGAYGCPGNFVNPDRPTPICAKRNCETGEIIDDGCSADGKCLKCSNDCGGKVAPRNGPVSSPMPR